jgi:protocatechuate 3,4-dioxygenase beta subunit
MPAKWVARRDVLQALGAGVAWGPLAQLVGCGDNAPSGRPTAGDAAADRGPLASGSGGAENVAASSDGGGWVTGGTASMTSQSSYPNPFARGSTSGCAATGALTQGPCYDSASVEIQDISYGQDGLPMRMYFQVLDSACNPMVGATVDVWHVAPTGKYSGNDSVNEIVAYCTSNDTNYTSHLYFRGRQMTNSTGVVFFDTCFPGWYSGRTIHVHFIIRAGSKSLTSQYLFDDALNDEIIGTQPIYNARGRRDTTNVTDPFVSASQYRQFLFQTQRMPDGAMLAWKAIVVSG